MKLGVIQKSFLGAAILAILATSAWFIFREPLPAPALSPAASAAQSTPAEEAAAEPLPLRMMEASPSPTAAARASGQEDLLAIFPPAELPAIVTEQGARASLRYLAQNGADLALPMPSRHRVFAANPEVGARLAAWARSHGFTVNGPQIVREHTGQPREGYELSRVEIPDPKMIAQEGQLIFAAVKQMPGTYYQTWSGEIVRR